MSTPVLNLSDNRSSSSQDRAQSNDDRIENGNRTEMLRDLSEPDQCDHSDFSKDRRNLIAYFFLGVCNAFLFYFGVKYQTFVPHHIGLFIAAIPIVLIKISPMFITAFVK